MAFLLDVKFNNKVLKTTFTNIEKELNNGKNSLS